ncbi:alanine racemase [Paenibacillus solisilvae]|uniref:Alanine racemase n=1 Tax=Paenibacillus solisilvae TaxID=2486751 RepID=A0ABW0W1K1_9BACL
MRISQAASIEQAGRYRDTWAKVDLGAIRSNVLTIRKNLPSHTKLMAVVKANGYGHGSVEAARMAIQAGAQYLAVAFLSEALQLRKNGITAPILILSPIKPQEVHAACILNVMLTVTSASWFDELSRVSKGIPPKKLKIHIKLDTGLGRIGIRNHQEWMDLVPWLQATDVIVDGVYTHFATAGREETDFLQKQWGRFQEMMAWVKNSGLKVNHYHCANSAAALRFPELAMDMVRIGAAMFGFYPKNLVPEVDLKPALSVYSSLMEVKKLSKGEYIGYDNSYQAQDEEWIGTVPIGYADGWSQSLRGSEVLVDGCRMPVVGKICMDQLMIRLPCYYPVGTDVTLIGKQGSQMITCAELASYMGSVAQEISTSLTSRISRSYTDSRLPIAKNRVPVILRR